MDEGQALIEEKIIYTEFEKMIKSGNVAKKSLGNVSGASLRVLKQKDTIIYDSNGFLAEITCSDGEQYRISYHRLPKK